MLKTPKGLRLQIGIYGRRNVGKSSFLNAVSGQEVAIVSDVPGTTTDPVEKAMEWLPIGPVLLIDTAGMDDVGGLGLQRVDKSRQAMQRTDIAAVVADPREWGDYEEQLIEQLRGAGMPTIVVFNKCDLSKPTAGQIGFLDGQGIQHVQVSASKREGITLFRDAVINLLPDDFFRPPAIVGDLIPPGGMVILVVPVDLEAPKGRLILPQVQTIRDLLDHDAICAVVKERELRHLLNRLSTPPDLVVTDSQAFLKVAADTPPQIPMTSFSILFARFKGDLKALTDGARAIENLRSGSRILVAEACTHHPVGEDIGRVKIPRWLTQYVGGKLDITTVSGHDFPDDVSGYDLVIHCGSCTFNRRELLTRIGHCASSGVPMTNYGIAIAYSLGIFERALAPFKMG